MVGVGNVEPPETLASTLPVEIEASPIVPVVVMAPPVSPLLVATFVTVPVPTTGVHDGFAPAPAVVRTCPAVPGFSAVQTVPDRYKICPWVPPIIASIIDVSELARGVDVPPLMLDKIVWVPIFGSCPSVALPDKLLNDGWLDDGMPDVDMELIHWFVTAA